MISCLACGRTMRWHNGQTGDPKAAPGRSLPRLSNYLGRGRSAFHPGQECLTPTKAAYICADQPVTLSSLATMRRTIHSGCAVIRARIDVLSVAANGRVDDGALMRRGAPGPPQLLRVQAAADQTDTAQNGVYNCKMTRPIVIIHEERRVRFRFGAIVSAPGKGLLEYLSIGTIAAPFMRSTW